MIHYNKKYDLQIEITGYRNISFTKTEKFLKTDRRKKLHKTEIQFFDADLIATEKHLYYAVLNALHAFEAESNISKSIAMEIILYVSAQHHIQRAIDQTGIKPETKNLAVVIVGKTFDETKAELQALTDFLGVAPDESVLELTDEKQANIQKSFEITDEEIETVIDRNSGKDISDLVIEHVALLATQL